MRVQRPSLTTLTMLAMLCCLLVMGAATEASASQSDTPTCAALSAPQSLAPSPQKPTCSPRCGQPSMTSMPSPSSSMRSRLLSGLMRANTLAHCRHAGSRSGSRPSTSLLKPLPVTAHCIAPESTAAAACPFVAHSSTRPSSWSTERWKAGPGAPASLPSTNRMGRAAGMMKQRCATLMAVRTWSPVTMTVRMLASCSLRTTSAVSGRRGLAITASPTRWSAACRSVSSWLQPRSTESGTRDTSPCARASTLRPSRV
mmetsp:Transcript_29272/g.64755  ORF Transcript_29272/g.64755 Transcript_29272/m.64755 type:complete len:257 (+) Transcript_29272:1907-2677(+)